jgi:hypothetical protein
MNDPVTKANPNPNPNTILNSDDWQTYCSKGFENAEEHMDYIKNTLNAPVTCVDNKCSMGGGGTIRMPPEEFVSAFRERFCGNRHPLLRSIEKCSREHHCDINLRLNSEVNMDFNDAVRLILSPRPSPGNILSAMDTMDAGFQIEVKTPLECANMMKCIHGEMNP